MHQTFLEIIAQRFGLTIVEQPTPLVEPQPVPVDRVLERLDRGMDFIFPHTNETTRSEMIVAPIAIHLAVSYELRLYIGNEFNADLDAGLSGTIDHLFSRAELEPSGICPVITTVMETKSLHLANGIPHCLVQIVAAQRLNDSPAPVYGVVTTGMSWRFLKLEGAVVTIESTEYPLFPLEPLLALLAAMVQ